MAKQKSNTQQQTETLEAEQLEKALGLSCKRIQVRGEEIAVEEFALEQLPQLLRLISGLMADVQGGVTEALLMQSGETGINLAMLATGKDRDWFRRIPLGDGLALYAAIIEVNASFFAQLPQLTEMMELFGGLISGSATNGRGSSASSAAPVTHLTQSGAIN